MGLKPDKTIDKSEMRKTFGGIFDSRTIMNLISLLKRGQIKNLGGIAKEGKESKILSADGKEGPVAVKIYLIESLNFKRIQPYLRGDRRFASIGNDKKRIIYAWCKKEFKNLSIARAAGVLCPEPKAFAGNVLVEEFIGEDFSPAPRLADIREFDAEKVFDFVLNSMKKLFSAGLVHGDLSEYNILLWKEQPWIIDFSQAVLLSHPNAEEFLQRDVKNVCNFFRKRGLGLEEENILAEIKKSSKEKII